MLIPHRLMEEILCSGLGGGTGSSDYDISKRYIHMIHKSIIIIIILIIIIIQYLLYIYTDTPLCFPMYPRSLSLHMLEGQVS